MAPFAALSGSAIALQGANRVRSDDIARNAVKRNDIAANAVNGAKVANGSLRVADFGGTLPRGATGPQGPTGATGPEGPPGPGGGGGGPPTGPAGGGLAGNYPNPTIAANAVGGAQIVNGSITNSEFGAVILRQGNVDNVAGNAIGSSTANCLAGEQVLSGGSDVSSSRLAIAEFRQSGNGWFVTGFNNNAGAATLQAEVLCLVAP